MDWIALSYSLPSAASSPRVTLWRRLKRLGAISPTGSLFILPDRENTSEAFQWLAQEIRQAGGEALLIRTAEVEGMDDAALIELFNDGRGEAYEPIAARLTLLEESLTPGKQPLENIDHLSELQQLQKQHGDVWRIDYFQSALGAEIAARLNRLSHQLLSGAQSEPVIEPLNKEDFQGCTWATRPRPHVDRLASAWFIRRFIDPAATILYCVIPPVDSIPFDYDAAADHPAPVFTHQGHLCTFEVLIRTFAVDDPAVAIMADIVNEIDLRDGRSARPETAGIDAALAGWLLTDLSDAELETNGLALFDGLYASLNQGLSTP